MTTYAIEQIDEVTLASGSALAGMDLMSPYVWREGSRYRLMVRRVPRPFLPDSPTGEICSGASDDGLTFDMDMKPSILPGPDAFDAGGCEDPTVLMNEGGGYSVFYTGVDAARRQGALLVARGPDLIHLTKQEVMLRAPPGEGNIKEATLVQTPSGDWRLFYEYAANDASRVGMAIGPSPHGPWTLAPNPFGIREDSWDNWHLSTGPVVTIEGHDPVMFYNGATADARWRIGWISFDAGFTRVTGRGLEPLLVPPPAVDRAATDIAFAASCVVVDGQISLYYSLEDRKLCRARVQVYGSEGRESSRQGQQPQAPPT
jgi:predicted GH43/DUF377 family glycosyl hydrolase